MQATNEELAKSLIDLIDETIDEIEELKKSSKFSAAEIEIKGPGEGIDGKPSNGELDAKKAEDEKKDEEDKKKKEDEAKKAEAVEKGVLEEKEPKKVDMPGKGFEEAKKAEDEKKEKKEEHEKKETKDEEKKEEKEFKKSETLSEDLMKSYVDTKIAPIEGKLNSIVDMITKLSAQPVERKSVPAGVQPMKKSEEFAAPLAKSEVASKLFELKKSGTKVDTLDLAKVETGSLADAQLIANKYGIK